MMQIDIPELRTGFSWPSRIGILATLVLLGALTFWAYRTDISGAVIASGSVVVSGKPKSVQHLDGGIIDEIRVEDGLAVQAGDILLTLDDTLLRANLDIYQNRLAETQARKDRLIAEQSGKPTIEFSQTQSLLAGLDERIYQEGQRELFVARAALQRGRSEQLSEKIAQFRNQISGVEGLIVSKQEQLAIVEQELNNAMALYEKGLTTEGQVLAPQRSEADLRGQISEHVSEVARIENSIKDTELEILQGERQFREQVVSELRELTTTASELTQQIISTQRQLDRVQIRAPVSGIVHEMQVATLGGVVPPGGVILQIIPNDQDLEFEMRVDPVNVDQIFIGQEASVRFPAFNQRSTPELVGAVTGVSPSSITDPASGLSYFKIEIAVTTEELTRLKNQQLVPGMPVEAFLQTQDRTVISYLLKPLSDQLSKAFREE